MENLSSKRCNDRSTKFIILKVNNEFVQLHKTTIPCNESQLQMYSIKSQQACEITALSLFKTTRGSTFEDESYRTRVSTSSPAPTVITITVHWVQWYMIKETNSMISVPQFLNPHPENVWRNETNAFQA